MPGIKSPPLTDGPTPLVTQTPVIVYEGKTGFSPEDLTAHQAFVDQEGQHWWAEHLILPTLP